MINRRFKTLVNEIDELKKNQDNVLILIRRIEGVETKAQDLWVLMESGMGKKGNGNDSALTSSDIKALNAQISLLK